RCLEHWLREYEVSRVYLNTLVHLEPVLAAKACDVPVFVHARELPAHDPALCEALNANPEQVRQHALESANVLIANSRYLAGYYQAAECCVVPNVRSEERRVGKGCRTGWSREGRRKKRKDRGRGVGQNGE